MIELFIIPLISIILGFILSRPFWRQRFYEEFVEIQEEVYFREKEERLYD
jgi:hypothetical protein